MSDTMVAERQEKRQAQGRQEQPRQEAPTMIPRVDVLEDETGITLLADLPGVSRESLEIHVEGDSLMIEGGVAAATPEAMEAAYAEVRAPRYRRSFTLSRELDGGRIEAQLKDGVLRLRIPKQEHAQPRRVSIKVA
ncbi:MAG TPA: Hsp20/alpha crystallin family protein [Burkholderiaceae bacterium]|nr:Hsp20/alpha crystallin family protein [Burkholderiaceae bacterium]